MRYWSKRILSISNQRANLMRYKHQIENRKEDFKNCIQLIENLIAVGAASAASQSEWKELDAELAHKYGRFNK